MAEQIVDKGEAYTIYLTDKVAPMVPYDATPASPKGRLNHGFIDLRDRPGAASAIAEAAGQPGLIAFLEKVNAEGSALMSLSCDVGLFLAEANTAGVTHKVSGYVDITFRDANLGGADNLEALARQLMTLHGPKLRGWATYALGVAPMISLFGRASACLAIHIDALGPSADDAWDNFNDHFGRLADVIRRIKFTVDR